MNVGKIKGSLSRRSMLNRIFKSSIEFKPLSQTEFQALREGAEVIEKDGYGEKVLLLPDGTYLKLFRRKRLISSALFYPYAKRFVVNAEKLEILGIRCPKVIGAYKFSNPRRDIVHYSPVGGLTLRNLKKEGKLTDETIIQTIKFVTEIHKKNIFFRSLHPGNIVFSNTQFGLIDISDLQIKSRGLSAFARRKNLQNLIDELLSTLP